MSGCPFPVAFLKFLGSLHYVPSVSLAAKHPHSTGEEVIGRCSWEGSVLRDQLAGEDPRPRNCPLHLFIDADVMTGTPAAPLDHEVNLRREAMCRGSKKARLWTLDDS